jgi:predicted permease
MISFRQLFRRRQIHDDLAEEIQEHLAETIDRLVSEGMPRAEAEFAARRRFGNVTRVTEQGREAWQMPRLEGWLAEIRFAFRRLKKAPGFASTAVVTLALGIGANVVVFSVLNRLVLRPLNVPDAANLYQIAHGMARGDFHSYPDYRDFRDRDAAFSGLLAYKFVVTGLQIDTATVRSWGEAASGNYFDVLGIQPAQGRFFHAADEHGLGSAPLVVLSDSFWRRQFAADIHVVGKTVRLNNNQFTIIGVAPPGFRGSDVVFAPDFWMPLVNAEQVTGWSDFCCRDHVSFTVLGRLKPGVSQRQATQSLNVLAAQMAKEDKKDQGLTLVLRQPGPAGDENDPTKKVLLAIMTLAVLLLLAACANLASIFAARAADRASELAVRMAIGASRWIVLRQLLAEALIISIVGGAAGTVIARILLGSLSTWQPFPDMPTSLDLIPDPKVYFAAAGLSLASGLLFGLLPARQIWRTNVVETIKAGYTHIESFRRFALRDILLLVQVVVCTLLVAASAVAVRGIQKVMSMPLGFNPQNVTLAQADLKMAGLTAQNSLQVQRQLLDDARALPGITAVTMADQVPFGNGGNVWFVYKWGTKDFVPAQMAFAAPTFQVAPGFARAIGMPLIAGRDFTWDDDKNAPNVAIVNETFARKLFGSESPIGQRFVLWATAKYEIVGEVADGKYYSPGEQQKPMMMMPLAQGVGGNMSSLVSLVLRSESPGNQVANTLGQLLKRDVPGTPFTISRWSDSINMSLAVPRAAAMVLEVMGLLAAVLAVTGIFGMASYSISKRMKEHGIRIAMGAERLQVMRAALGRPVLLLGCGALLGVATGLMASNVVARLVVYAAPSDPLVLLSICAIMIVIGLIGTWIPARRTLAIDPARLLREP